MKRVSVTSGCFNEEDNLEELVARVFKVAQKCPQYDWEFILIDNCSTDGSADILRSLAKTDSRVKVILNIRNFGHIRSPYHAMMQATGDAVIYLASDLQDPPELLERFVEEWEKGAKVVAAIKSDSEESKMFFLVRRAYYNLVRRMASVDLLQNFTGFGLYDRQVVEGCRSMDDPYPYHRGMISELGFPVTRVPFKQPRRKRGFSKNNFYTLFDIAMLGFTNHTKVPLRLATIAGFACSAFFLVVAIGYFVAKLLFWKNFALGQAPVVVGLFFVGSIQLFFIGVIGEYIGAIHTRVSKRPLVVEKERINF